MTPETLAELLAAARRQVTDAGIETAALDARLLLQAVTGLSHEDMIARDDQPVEPAAVTALQALIGRRLAREPVSRILGQREFYGRSFKVTSDVLDPRPDTETLVNLALRLVPRGLFIDLGTGSGAIAITLCAENPDLSGIATDLSAEALAVARTNAENVGVLRWLNFRQGSWLEGVEGRFDLIISNPPYIAASEQLPPEVRDYDPALALFGGTDGLDAYRVISRESGTHITTKGIVAVEIGSTQAAAVQAIFAKQGFSLVEAAKDLAGHDRAMAFRIS